jgi:hypothetical protein
MITELRPGEQVVKQGAANLQKNVETVGGKLYLTNERLIFEAHRINVQGGVTQIELEDVKSTLRCWTRFLGFLPVFPNSLAVQTRQGKDYRFVLLGRHAWQIAIEESR